MVDVGSTAELHGIYMDTKSGAISTLHLLVIISAIYKVVGCTATASPGLKKKPPLCILFITKASLYNNN